MIVLFHPNADDRSERLSLFEKIQHDLLEQGRRFGGDAVTGLRKHLVLSVTIPGQLPGVRLADNRIIGTAND